MGIITCPNIHHSFISPFPLSPSFHPPHTSAMAFICDSRDSTPSQSAVAPRFGKDEEAIINATPRAADLDLVDTLGIDSLLCAVLAALLSTYAFFGTYIRRLKKRYPCVCGTVISTKSSLAKSTNHQSKPPRLHHLPPPPPLPHTRA